jgi:hypothetical protein
MQILTQAHKVYLKLANDILSLQKIANTWEILSSACKTLFMHVKLFTEHVRYCGCMQNVTDTCRPELCM